jgi:hypothetical protein
MKGFFIVLGINCHFQDAKILPPTDRRSELYLGEALSGMEAVGRQVKKLFIWVSG